MTTVSAHSLKPKGKGTGSKSSSDPDSDNPNPDGSSDEEKEEANSGISGKILSSLKTLETLGRNVREFTGICEPEGIFEKRGPFEMLGRSFRKSLKSNLVWTR